MFPTGMGALGRGARRKRNESKCRHGVNVGLGLSLTEHPSGRRATAAHVTRRHDGGRSVYSATCTVLPRKNTRARARLFGAAPCCFLRTLSQCALRLLG